MPLNPFQLDQISTEYYVKGFVLGRNALYIHMKYTYPPPNPSPIGNSPYTSRDDIGEWLKYQVVNQRFQYQRKPKVVSSMIPVRPFHSISIDLIDKSKQPSLVIKKGLVRKSYHYIFVIIDNFSRYMYCFPLENKQPKTLTREFMNFYEDIFEKFPYLNELEEPIGFCHMDNGGEFKGEFKAKLEELDIGISNTIPYMPQSNSLVERSNGIIKRIFNKLIFIHADQEYSKWSEYLDQAVEIYNNKINTTIGVTPAQAVQYEHVEDYNNVIESVKGKAIKPAPFQNSYAEGQVVRLRIPKGKLDKFDKPNWSQQKYTITSVLQQSQDDVDETTAKPTRYKITPIDGGREQSVKYVRESLLAIPPILKPPKMTSPPLPPRGLVGYNVNINYDFLNDFIA